MQGGNLLLLVTLSNSKLCLKHKIVARRNGRTPIFCPAAPHSSSLLPQIFSSNLAKSTCWEHLRPVWNILTHGQILWNIYKAPFSKVPDGKFPELNHVFVSLSSFVIFHLEANKKLLDTGGVPWCSSVEKPEFVHLIFLPPSYTKIVWKLGKFCDNDDDGSVVGKHGAVLYCLQSFQPHFAQLCPFPFTISIYSNLILIFAHAVLSECWDYWVLFSLS